MSTEPTTPEQWLALGDPIKCRNCGKTFRDWDDCDTLGADNDACCPDCGCEDFREDCDDLPVKLAEAFTPKPYRHAWPEYQRYGTIRCAKCHATDSDQAIHTSCSVPDPIKIDWNEAKYRQGKCDIMRFQIHALDVMREVTGHAEMSREIALQTLALMCRPEDAKTVLIIAAMAWKPELCPRNNDKQGDVYDDM